MKKKFWSKLVCAALVLVLAVTLLPGTVQAADNEQLGLYFSSSAVLSMGQAITLEAGSVSGTTKIKVGSSYVDFSKLKLSNGSNIYKCAAGDVHSADLSAIKILGGAFYGMTTDVSITMTGGSVEAIYGSAADPGVTHTGNINIHISGGSVKNVYGGTHSSGTIDGNVSITMTGGNVSTRLSPKGGTTEAVITGDAQVVITGGTIGNYMQQMEGEIQGTVSLYDYGSNHSAQYNQIYHNYVYREGNTWKIKGDTAKALNGTPLGYLTISNGQTLTVNQGQTFSGGIDNYGTIYNYGTISDSLDNQGTVHNYGTISAEVYQDDVGTIYNYGTVGSVDGGYVTKEVSYNPYYCALDQSAWEHNDHNAHLDYTATVTPSAGHVLDDSFYAVVTQANGSEKYLESGKDFEYNPRTGAIKIPSSKMTGPVHLQTYTYFDLSSAALKPSLSEDTFTFDGKEHKPALLLNGVAPGESGLSIVYENNVNAGTGKVTFKAAEVSQYVNALTLEFTIQPADVADVEWTVEELSYNGEAQLPTITGKLGSYTLQPADYETSGAAQVDVDDYTLPVNGKGNFTGSKILDWSIAPLDIASAEVGLDKEPVYDGTEQTVSVTGVTLGGRTLQEGVDFTVSGNTGIEAGDYQMTITGMGNYTGSLQADFRIAPKALTVDDLEFADGEITKVYDATTDSDAKVQVKAGTIGNEEPLAVNGAAVYNDATVAGADKVTFTTQETVLGNYAVPAGLKLEKEAAITKREITVSGITAKGRRYDGTRDVDLKTDEMVVENRVADDMTVVVTAVADSADVGERTGTLQIELRGESAENYLLSADSQQTVTLLIYQRTWWVTGVTKSGGQYIPTVEGFLEGEQVTAVATSEPEPVYMGEGWYMEFAPEGEDAGNYEIEATYSGPVELEVKKGREYTTTTNDWTGEDFTVTAAEGYVISTLEDGTYGAELTFSDEGENTATFYVKQSEKGFVSKAVEEPYKIDKTAPLGKITIGEESWDTFFEVDKETITNADVAAQITAEDSGSGVAKVEYLATYRMWHEEDLERITEWVEGSEVKVTAEDGKMAFIYAKITDKAGNVAFVASDGWAFDTLAPGVFGVKEGVTYYVDTAVTVSDKNLLSVTCNGVDVGASFTIEGGAVGEYVIVATDKAGNKTMVSFATGKLEDAGAALEGLTPENVKLEQAEDISELLDELEEQDLSKATEEQKAALEELTEQAQALMEQLEKLEEAASTEAISKTVEILDTDAGTIGDIDVLKQAIKDMDQLLEDFDGNLTEADKQTVQEVREQAEELLKKLEKKAAATTPATGDLLLPIAGAVCVLALVGMAVVLILKKKYAK